MSYIITSLPLWIRHSNSDNGSKPIKVIPEQCLSTWLSGATPVEGFKNRHLLYSPPYLWILTEQSAFLRSSHLGHLGGSVSWASDSWFQLRSCSLGHSIKLSTDSASDSLPLFCCPCPHLVFSFSFTLSLKKNSPTEDSEAQSNATWLLFSYEKGCHDMATRSGARQRTGIWMWR